MARTREFDPDEALSSATNVFWRSGYADTSMEDIVSETGVSRYGLYGAFGNKKQLLIESMRHYCSLVAEAEQKELRRPDAGRAEIIAFWEAKKKAAASEEFKHGCLIGNIAAEVAPHDPEVASAVQAMMNEHTEVYANAIQNGQKTGDINPNIDPVATGRMLCSLGQGLALMLRAGAPLKDLGEAIDAGLKVLDP